MPHPIRSPFRSVLPLVLAAFLVAACSDAPGWDRARAHRPLAEGLALALGRDEVRASVHDAMRASPHLDHKLELQAYLASPEGEPLREATAAALGGEADLAAALARLPADMDFYVPFEAHRATWTHAEEDLAVVVTVDPDADEGVAWHPDGRRERLASEADLERAALGALFVVHPAEPKVEHGRPPHEGPTIQDPSGAGAAAAPATQGAEQGRGTYVSAITMDDCDGLFNETCEVYFKARGRPIGDSRYIDPFRDTRTLHIPANERSVFHPSWVELTGRVPWGYETAGRWFYPIDVRMYEADSGLLEGDDWYGDFRLFYEWAKPMPTRHDATVRFRIVGPPEETCPADPLC